MIDGLDGIAACYSFAGIVGIRPHGLTLNQLWQMAAGRIQQQRATIIDQTQLIWGMQEIDVESYLYFGTMEETGVGGPVQLDPETQAKVDAEIERIRRENPDLPTFRGMKT